MVIEINMQENADTLNTFLEDGWTHIEEVDADKIPEDAVIVTESAIQVSSAAITTPASILQLIL